jgi:hypothetical protein
VDALRSGGVRGLVGGLSKQEEIQQARQRQIAAGLDRQQMMIEQMRAQDRAAVRGMQEERESFDYQMLAGQRAAGRQAIYSGVGDMVSAGAFAAMNMEGEDGETGGTPPPPPSVVTGQDYVPTRRGGKTTTIDLFLNEFGNTPSYMKQEY